MSEYHLILMSIINDTTNQLKINIYLASLNQSIDKHKHYNYAEFTFDIYFEERSTCLHKNVNIYVEL